MFIKSGQFNELHYDATTKQCTFQTGYTPYNMKVVTTYDTITGALLVLKQHSLQHSRSEVMLRKTFNDSWLYSCHLSYYGMLDVAGYDAEYFRISILKPNIDWQTYAIVESQYLVMALINHTTLQTFLSFLEGVSV